MKDKRDRAKSLGAEFRSKANHFEMFVDDIPGKAASDDPHPHKWYRFLDYVVVRG